MTLAVVRGDHHAGSDSLTTAVGAEMDGQSSMMAEDAFAATSPAPTSVMEDDGASPVALPNDQTASPRPATLPHAELPEQEAACDGGCDDEDHASHQTKATTPPPTKHDDDNNDDEDDNNNQDDQNSSATPVTQSTAATDEDDDDDDSSIQQQLTNTKQFRFAVSTRYYEIQHINDYTENEIQSVWYTMDEYYIMKQEIQYTVQQMMLGRRIVSEDVVVQSKQKQHNNNNPQQQQQQQQRRRHPSYDDSDSSEDEDDDELPFQFPLCARGLEFKTKAGSRVRSRNKLRTRSAVLNEQDLQREEGHCDPDFIAMACMEESLECRENARARGLYDEIAVEDYLKDVRDAWCG
eukprot:CAMPEP_0119562310 /NCGR_PEP_ID=MMETSP1352-20130426/20005_1 /TAXON_ID=265584 /ORGANISM="Stauroneis constricta, Strain CCMP1120" /LENGTH=349 /DNA_ID=CAMNT_0007610677 /DNA_START=246 /DNA_END=1295 /DNA_ORIENTATION=-